MTERRRPKKLPDARLSVDMIETVRANNPLHKIAANYTKLTQSGAEWSGCCPFHKEKSASFRIYPDEHFHCFGCGEHGDVFDIIMNKHRVDFFSAYEMLGGTRDLTPAVDLAEREPPADIYTGYTVITPVPDDVPPIEPGKRTPKILNPKRIDDADKRETAFSPQAIYPYRDAGGKLLCYELRVTFQDGHKITPIVTWCSTPFGDERWCLVTPDPRPLCGLDELEARPEAVVIVTEGAKARDGARQLLPNNVVVSWWGGGNAIEKTDWSPLIDRHVVGWADNDGPGLDAWLRSEDMSGEGDRIE